MLDLISQMWLSATRRTLTAVMAILSLAMGVAVFICLSAFSRSYLSSLARRWDFTTESAIADGPIVDLSVSFGERHTGGRFDAAQIDRQVRRALASGVGSMMSGDFDVKVGRHALNGMRVTAVSSEYLRLRPHFMAMGYRSAGRLFTPEDDASGEAVCVIDERLAAALPPDTDPVGQSLRIAGRRFRIIGTVSPGLGGRHGLLLVSFCGALPLFETQPPGGVAFVVKSAEQTIQSDIERVRNAVARALGAEYDITSRSMWADLEERRYQLSYTRLFLGAVCLLPLIVGLVGMVSMLLADLNSRVHEIGLHRALGATRSRQAALVLSEAGITGLVASLVGIPIGLITLHYLTLAWGGNLQASLRLMITSVFCAPATSLLAGLIPARAAIRISPAEALRAE